MKKIFFLFFTLLFGSDKIFIPGGEYVIPKGDTFYTKNFKEEKIKIKPFYIDKYEFSYDRVPKSMIHIVPIYILRSKYDIEKKLPVYTVKYEEALKICRLKGGDLPTEEQWMVAAGFENGKFYKFPTKHYPLTQKDLKEQSQNYLQQIDDKYYLLDDYAPVNEALKGNNQIYGMLGNVWEMVKSKGKYVLVKGGSFYDFDRIDLFDIRVRNYVLKKYVPSTLLIGFRCVYEKQ